MHYKKIKQFETVFLYGEQGDRFYFLIQGCASVHIPVLNQNVDAEDFLKVNEWSHVRNLEGKQKQVKRYFDRFIMTDQIKEIEM